MNPEVTYIPHEGECDGCCQAADEYIKILEAELAEIIERKDNIIRARNALLEKAERWNKSLLDENVAKGQTIDDLKTEVERLTTCPRCYGSFEIDYCPYCGTQVSRGSGRESGETSKGRSNVDGNARPFTGKSAAANPARLDTPRTAARKEAKK